MKTFTQFVESANSTLESARRIAALLKSHGHQAYLVGGCVRDGLLGLHPKDYDLATDAVPDKVLKLFPDADKVGAHFGVVIVDGIEVATFRSDSVDSDGRRPTHVTYETSPKADASRRDFTVNALFQDPFTGHTLDFFGGLDDLRHKILRAVGDPHKRFQEDHLRMMRAVRFAAKLGFTIDPDTLDAMAGHAHKINEISVERQRDELRKALSHDAVKSIQMMKNTGLLFQILPEVDHLSSSDYTVTMQCLRLLDNPSPEDALCALFSELGATGAMSSAKVEGVAKRLLFTNDETAYVTGVLKLQDHIQSATHSTPMDVLKKLMRDKLFAPAMKLFGNRIKIHKLNHAADAYHFLFNLRLTMAHGDLHPVKLITGDDLIDLGIKPGKIFKDLLNQIEVGQLTGEITTRAQAIAFATARR